MHKLMCTFMTPMKKKIPDRNLDTSCPAGIPCKNTTDDKSMLGFSIVLSPLDKYVNGLKTTENGDFWETA